MEGNKASRKKVIVALLIVGLLLIAPMLSGAFNQVKENDHEATQMIVTLTSDAILKDTLSLAMQKEEGDTFEFDTLKLAAEELDLPDTIELEIGESSISVFSSDYPEEKIILTISQPGEWAAEAVGFKIKSASE